MFQDAARSLEAVETPSRPSSNTKCSRIPLSQARYTRFGSLGQGDGLRASSRTRLYRPPNPASPTPQIQGKWDVRMTDVTYPALRPWGSPRALPDLPGYDSMEEDQHSTHGVPLILPLQPKKRETSGSSSVDTWLDEVIVSTLINASSRDAFALLPPATPEPHKGPSTPPPTPSTPPTDCPSPSKKPHKSDSSSASSSNKENHPPKPRWPAVPPSLSSPPVRPHSTEFLSANLSRFGITPFSPPPPSPSSLAPQPLRVRSTCSPSPRPPPRTPPGQLTRAPIRKTSTPRKGNKEHGKGDQDGIFTIHEDQIVPLSPRVAINRRGKARKEKGRFASYYDEDVLNQGAGMDLQDEATGREILKDMTEATKTG